MDVKILEYILEIANQKNITKAAEALFVSQSSLSQSLMKLEQELGTELFIRKKNQLTVTDAGQLYIAAAKRVLQIQKQLYRNISNLNQTGLIRIAVTTQWGIQLLTDIMSDMQRRYPGIIIKILEAKFVDIKQQFASGKLDFALLAIPALDELNETFAIVDREEIYFAVCAKHPFCIANPQLTTVTTDDLRTSFEQDSFVMPAQGSTLKRLIDEYFNSEQYCPNVICEVNRNNSIQYMVSKGIGVAVMPGCYRNDVPGIRYFSFTPHMYRYNALAYRKTLQLSEAETHLIKLLKDSPFFQGAQT